jgi:hypothetical protein
VADQEELVIGGVAADHHVSAILGVAADDVIRQIRN